MISKSKVWSLLCWTRKGRKLVFFNNPKLLVNVMSGASYLKNRNNIKWNKYLRLKPLKMLSNDMTRIVFLNNLFLHSWYKFRFPSSTLNSYNTSRGGSTIQWNRHIRKSSKLLFRTNFLKLIEIKVILEVFPCVLTIKKEDQRGVYSFLKKYQFSERLLLLLVEVS